MTVLVAVGGTVVEVGRGVALGVSSTTRTLVEVGPVVAAGITGMEVIVGLKTAVMVKSGVGKMISVGVDVAVINGKLHANPAAMVAITAVVGIMSFFRIVSS